MQIVDYWTLIIIIGNISHILGCFFQFLPDQFLQISIQDFVMGLGTFITWLSATRYLQYSKSMNTFPATMISAGKIILLAVISSLPLIIGIAFMCLCQFGMSWRFQTLSGALMQLISLMNGDEVQNIYHNLVPLNFVIGFFFCFTWVFFSNNCLTPTFLAISEDGYIEQSQQTKFGWLEDDGLKDIDLANDSNQCEHTNDDLLALDQNEQKEVDACSFAKSVKQTQFLQNKLLLESQINLSAEEDGFISHQIRHNIHIQEIQMLE
mmetsp:Transcript_7867/g.13191  ORF Transcript_7867/g.13191 Transcript_7867/m.13191 type:complete len:265 (-) Transcript_7867:555-1349(-)